MRPRPPGGCLHDVILRATAQILSREGLARLTTNRVAEKAGVSIGSLYQYFPNEDPERRLLQQVAASWLEARRDEIRRPDRVLAAAIALDTAEALIHGVALRSPERLADDEFAAEVTDLLVRYLAK